MSTVMFDTLKIVEKLQASGFDERQAKGMVSIMLEERESNFQNLTTKQDMATFQAATKQDMATFQAATKQDMAAFQAATKQSIAALEVATKTSAELLRRDIDINMESTKSDLRLVKWMLALVALVNVVPALKTFFV